MFTLLISNDLQPGATLPKRHVFNSMRYIKGIIFRRIWRQTMSLMAAKASYINAFDPDMPISSGWWSTFRRMYTCCPQNAGSSQDHLLPGETHCYPFTINALDVKHLEINEDASGAMISFNVHFYTLGSALLTVTYR